MKRLLKRVLPLSLALILGLTSAVACNNNGDDEKETEPKTTQGKKTPENDDTPDDTDKETPDDNEGDEGDEGDTFIADRTITIQAFAGDVGNALPPDVNETPIGKELTKRTGIKLDIRYTPGESSLQVLTTQLAAGTIPEVIVAYLNHSARPEFPILLKAAREGLLADIQEELSNTKVYSKYFEEGYLPADTKNNIMFRDDLEGTYMVHLSIPREEEDINNIDRSEEYVGGMYIQKEIAESLDIDPREIRTVDQLMDLLRKIRDGGFTDDNGRPVTPLGPKFWGGSADALDWVLRPLNWGSSGGYNITEDGVVMHEAQTKYSWDKISTVRTMLEEDLIHPEFFTMDESRANEVSYSKNSAIIGDVHNYQPIIYETGDWLPVGIMNDVTGDPAKYYGGKGGYGVWAMKNGTENAQEVVDYMDYITTYEGKLLTEYGIEGEHYEMKDGNPHLKEDVLNAINENDDAYLMGLGGGFGGYGVTFFNYMMTDLAPKDDFGEAFPGASEGSSFTGAVEIAEYADSSYRKVLGLSASAYENRPEFESFKSSMATVDYKSALVDAMYAQSDDAAKSIMASFVNQLEAAGINDYLEFLTKEYEETPEAISFVPYGTSDEIAYSYK